MLYRTSRVDILGKETVVIPNDGLLNEEGSVEDREQEWWNCELPPFFSMNDDAPYVIACRSGNWVYLRRSRVWVWTLWGVSIHKHPNKLVVAEFKQRRNKLTGRTFDELDARLEAELEAKASQPILRWSWNPWYWLWVGICLAIVVIWLGANIACLAYSRAQEKWRYRGRFTRE